MRCPRSNFDSFYNDIKTHVQPALKKIITDWVNAETISSLAVNAEMILSQTEPTEK